MPIKLENKHRYPANWKTEIRPAILARANNRCEQCNATNGEMIYRGAGYHADYYMTFSGHVYDGNTGEYLGEWATFDVDRTVRVVLTIAHLDHTPENCDPNNLRAWCQRCHLAYDAEHHKHNARLTRRAHTTDMFGNERISQ